MGSNYVFIRSKSVPWGFRTGSSLLLSVSFYLPSFYVDRILRFNRVTRKESSVTKSPVTKPLPSFKIIHTGFHHPRKVYPWSQENVENIKSVRLNEHNNLQIIHRREKLNLRYATTTWWKAELTKHMECSNRIFCDFLMRASVVVDISSKNPHLRSLLFTSSFSREISDEIAKPPYFCPIRISLSSSLYRESLGLWGLVAVKANVRNNEAMWFWAMQSNAVCGSVGKVPIGSLCIPSSTVEGKNKANGVSKFAKEEWVTRNKV